MPRPTLEAWDTARKAREADPTNPALLEAELAAEREHFRRLGFQSRLRRLVVYGAVVIAFALVTAKLAEQQGELHGAVNENRGLVTSLHSALVESCEVNGNAARQVTRETLHEEIASAEHPDKALVEALNIPPKTLQRITAETVAKLRERLARVKPVDCAKQYEISSGN